MLDTLNTPQPPPQANDQPAVWDLVLADLPGNVGPEIAALLEADIRERDGAGAKKYGVRLQPFNGRDWMVDAYQECLDLLVYARQGMAEEGSEYWGDPVALDVAGRTYTRALESAVDLRTALKARDVYIAGSL